MIFLIHELDYYAHFNLPVCLKLERQIIHLNFFPLWIDSICFFKLHFIVKLEVQVSYFNVSHLCRLHIADTTVCTNFSPQIKGWSQFHDVFKLHQEGCWHATKVAPETFYQSRCGAAGQWLHAPPPPHFVWTRTLLKWESRLSLLCVARQTRFHHSQRKKI